jgi:hypothetical protein
MILKEGFNNLPIQLRVVSQLAVFPTCKPQNGANPKTPVPRYAQGSNIAAGKTLACWWPPRSGPNAIKAQQAEFGAEPEITVGGLSNREDDAFGEAVADSPCRVRILTRVERWG